ncbi:subtilase family protein [Striga hermonthica]|uniref:Subtilase family protein n=1 Tax=Striga hermonthica TaxID=68872 RepID=A0A9N7P224_STRHE|nr:subtilase family protein [Striga hermonthica]
MASATQEKKVHIVHLGEHIDHKTPEEIEGIHHSYLSSVKENEDDAKSSLIYSYKKISGFAALLTPHEAHKLSEMENVMSVFQSHGHKDNLWLKSKYGENIIIGVIDSGVWPESKSFNDEGMGPIPHTWKGICQSGDAFNSSHCNRKIIGARYYHKGTETENGPVNRTIDFLSPRDVHGHGTHTASTAAGRRVDNVSSSTGFAPGVATGGAPMARLAIYKVDWLSIGSSEADVLAAFDDAIADGVHIISISMNNDDPTPYASSGITVGAFHAVRYGIVVAGSAGNFGPVLNEALWMVTVGATSLDRMFKAPCDVFCPDFGAKVCDVFFPDFGAKVCDVFCPDFGAKVCDVFCPDFGAKVCDVFCLDFGPKCAMYSAQILGPKCAMYSARILGLKCVMYSVRIFGPKCAMYSARIVGQSAWFFLFGFWDEIRNFSAWILGHSECFFPARILGQSAWIFFARILGTQMSDFLCSGFRSTNE